MGSAEGLGFAPSQSGLRPDTPLRSFTPENPEQRATSLCTLRSGTVCHLRTPSKE
ncbi:MAG: hypothetical protein J6L98_06390 [Bacteroidales bacterium]|nr:hypothetical protein [Bacteroidales bacterium]